MSTATQILATQAANLKGYWKCDETSGTTLADSSGNSKDLTLSGTPATDYNLNQSGQDGAAIQFLGAAGYASRTDSVIGSSPSAMTLLAFVKGSSQAGGRILAFGRGSVSTNPIIDIQAEGRGVTGFHRSNTGTASQNLITGGGPALDDSFHCVVYRLGSGVYDILCDAALVNRLTTTVSTTTLDRTAIGALLRATAGNFFAGYIQHVAAWDVALTDNEIKAIVQASGLTAKGSGRFSFSLLGRSDASLSSDNCQGVAYDGAGNYFFSAGFGSGLDEHLYKYTRSGNTYTETLHRDISGDDPSDANQYNGLNYFGGSLWVGANNYNDTPKLGWIIEYDPSDLTWIATHSVGANWSEGGAWHDVGDGDEIWVVFADLAAVRRYDASFSLIAQYDLDFVAGQTHIASLRSLYQGAAWYTSEEGDHYLFVQTHAVNEDTATHVYRWNGSGFDCVQVIAALGDYVGQGLHWETVGDVMLFAERTPTDQNIVRAQFADAGNAVSIAGIASRSNVTPHRIGV